ncbi:MAG: cation:proton antiporter [Spirochaetes bacterium]|nr:cation:proton antiporter [Spirochaetota bacterium]
MGIAEDIIIIILAGLVTAFIAHKLKLPLLLGYIAAGIVIGPYTAGITVGNVHDIELLAEIGVALLLFSIGLDISFKEIREVRKIALIGTPIQLALTIGYGMAIGRLLGLPWTASILIGAIMSLSSTMVVFKTLMSMGLMGTLSSRVMVGMLIVQDLAAVPMMIMIPQLHNIGNSLSVLGITVLKGVLILSLVLVVGSRLIPMLLRQVARLESRELFLLAVTALGLGIGFLTYRVGLSFALGAFVTGMVLNRSDYSHKALHDIIPLRDLFGMFFFTSVGMLVDPGLMANNIGLILLLVALIIAGKALIFSVLSRIFGYYNVIPLAVGLGLSQVGEFSFVLARMGLGGGLIARETYSIILAAAVVTMVLSPFLSMLTAPVYSLKNRLFKREKIQTTNFPAGGLRDHVVIAGAGRVGRNIAATLQHLGYCHVMIEQDYALFEKAKKIGCPVIYGDAAEESVLAAAEIRSARLLLITIPVLIVAREILSIGLKLNPKLNVIARGNSLEEVHELYAMRVGTVVQPEFEASIEIVRQALLHLGISAGAIQGYIDDIRRREYSPLIRENPGLLSNLKNASYLLEMNWYRVPPGSRMAGKSIKELEIRSGTGATVVGVYRSNEFFPNPNSNFVFMAEDMVAVIGTADNRKSFEEMMSPA